MHTDDFPEESSWKLFFDGGTNAIAEGAASGDDTSAKRFDSNGNEITTPGGGAADRNIVFEWSTCLTVPGSYAWTFDDAWGDGICCNSTYYVYGTHTLSNIASSYIDGLVAFSCVTLLVCSVLTVRLHLFPIVLFSSRRW